MEPDGPFQGGTEGMSAIVDRRPQVPINSNALNGQLKRGMERYHVRHGRWKFPSFNSGAMMGTEEEKTPNDGIVHVFNQWILVSLLVYRRMV